MAYERGESRKLGHLKGIARLLTHESYKKKLRRWLRAALLLATGMYRAKIGLVLAQYEEENDTTMSDDEVTSAEADRRDAER